jgi:nitrite reductase/ring-hydroxylating ferredoxin subunit
MARRRVLDAAALAPGERTVVTVDGEDVALFRSAEGEWLAVGNACVHQGGSLCDGRVEGDIVTCLLHGWEFDLRSGACMTVPGERVSRWLATVEGDGIHLEAEE